MNVFTDGSRYPYRGVENGSGVLRLRFQDRKEAEIASTGFKGYELKIKDGFEHPSMGIQYYMLEIHVPVTIYR